MDLIQLLGARLGQAQTLTQPVSFPSGTIEQGCHLANERVELYLEWRIFVLSHWLLL